MELGCCVYTVADEFARAPYETLYKLAEIGYTTTEIGDFSILGVADWQAVQKSTGLKMACTHFAIQYQEAWTKHIIEFARALGSRYIGYPALRQIANGAKEDYLREAEAMNRLGRIYADCGIKMIYHNHDFEFVKHGGEYGLDILRENTDPAYVGFELDTYWIARGGEIPEEYIKKFAGRCDIVHFKDMAEDGFFAPVGEGTLNMEAIFKAAAASGAKIAMVEQDAHRKPSLDCAKSSYDYLRKIVKRF
jgi:sugar phosphate isomerase/epimerase